MTSPVVLGNRPLSPLQQKGLDWVQLWGGRDVALAIDLTESVGLNDSGRLHLRHIVEQTLNKGDTIHIIPFATTARSPITIEYQGEQDIPKILEVIPMDAGPERGTDIQCAELYVYRYLAQLNQRQLQQQQPIKAQSVIWLTDAPLNIPQGESQRWTEAPNSPCGIHNSPRADERSQWLGTLPMTQRSIQPGQFQLTVVDIPPTVQEFCTPKPGGGEVCLVNSYLWGQLWWQLLLVSLLGMVVGSGGLFFFIRWLRQQLPWTVTVAVGDQEYRFPLKHAGKIGLGELVSGSLYFVSLPCSEAVGFLLRQHNTLRIGTVHPAKLTYRGQQIYTNVNGQEIDTNVFVPRNNEFVIVTYNDIDIQITITM
ncbi:VWA domain-containing protein [Parathermosynechococcus lividus]